jgi:hypothetical protein
MGRCRFDSSVSRQGPVEGSPEHGNQTSRSIECWVLANYKHLRMDTTLRIKLFNVVSKKLNRTFEYK